MGAAEAIAMIPSEPVAIHIGRPPEDRKPLMPDQVESAGLLLWLDANDMDGDGKEDDPPPRRGAVIGWRSRVGDVKFDGFVFYQPNVQNGKGIASWETIWIQNLNKPVSGFQTIIMVRRVFVNRKEAHLTIENSQEKDRLFPRGGLHAEESSLGFGITFPLLAKPAAS